MGVRNRSFGKKLGTVVVCSFVAALFPGAAAAQTISGLSVTKNAGNSANEFTDGLFESFERTTAITTTSTSTSFSSRYEEAVGVDEGVPSSDKTETQNSDYTASFSVTAPRGYHL